MKISVAIATYNGENFIEEQLCSILKQTRQVDEVVICDDGSTDRTVEIVQSFLQRNSLAPRWSLHVNEKNLGYADNFKKAAYFCTGDLIFFCDQDDIWVDDRVEIMAQTMQEHPKISVLTSKLIWFSDECGKAVLYNRKKDKVGKLKHIPFNPKNAYLRAPGCVMCVKGSFLKEIESDWYNGWAQDEAVWCLSVVKSSLYELDHVTLYRRDHANRTSGKLGHQKEKRMRYLQDLLLCTQKMVSFAMVNGNEKAAKVYFKCYKMARRRIELLNGKRMRNAFGLLFYLKYYYSKRSFIAELLMA